MSERIPRDLQIQILVRLPVKSLLRFQCVSKSCKSLISSDAFISMHTKHNESANNYAHFVNGCLYRADNDENMIDFGYKLHQFNDSFSAFQEIEFPSQIASECIEQVLDCRGLLLLTHPDHPYDYKLQAGTFEPLILWNPAIRMSMTLPPSFVNGANPRYYSVFHGFGYDHIRNDYKVLRVMYNDESFPPMAKFFKLRTRAWETVNGFDFDDFHYVILKGSHMFLPQAFVNGATHWLGYNSRCSVFREAVVLLFHMCDEKFRVMKFPNVLNNILQSDLISLVVLDGLLSLIELNNWGQGDCCVWLMKEYGVPESWTKQYAINLGDWEWLFQKFVSFRNKSEFLVVTSNQELALYNLKTRRYVFLGIRKTKLSLLIMKTCIESLVLLGEFNVVRE
jgi:F-box interacting protein